MTQAQIEQLFGRDVSTVLRHIGNILDDGKLDELGSLQKVQTTNGRLATTYSLGMVISVGYRVSSAQVTMIIRQSNSAKAQRSAEVHNCAHFESRQMAMAYGIIELPPENRTVTEATI